MRKVRLPTKILIGVTRASRPCAMNQRNVDYWCPAHDIDYWCFARVKNQRETEHGRDARATCVLFMCRDLRVNVSHLNEIQASPLFSGQLVAL